MVNDKKSEIVSEVKSNTAEAKTASVLSSEDRGALEMAKLNRKLAVSSAEKALAENQVAELTFKNLVLQLYMKYGLTEADGIDEQGNLIRSADDVNKE